MYSYVWYTFMNRGSFCFFYPREFSKALFFSTSRDAIAVNEMQICRAWNSRTDFMRNNLWECAVKRIYILQIDYIRTVFSRLLSVWEISRSAGRRIFTRRVKIFDCTFFLPLFPISFGLYSEFFLALENLCASWPFLVNFTACWSKTPSPRATSYFVKPVTRENNDGRLSEDC